MMRIELSDLGDIDFGIITIREDEYLAVFDRLSPEDVCQGRRTYDVGSVITSEGGQYRFALIRAIAQGEGTAQDVARDMVEDLHPKWLLLVGIGGAVPSADFTLGDVVCATRVHDFCVRAAKFNSAESFAAGGGPMHRDVENLLSRLPGIERRLPDWNSHESIGMPMPEVEVPGEGSDRYYGSKEWQADVRRWLTHRFKPSGALRRPSVTARPVASSDVLVKDSNLLEQWLTEARAVAAVEMELAGVYFAARRHDREYPILAIRGISDVVGFKRDEAWTKYACNTAAAFAVALIKSGEMHLPRLTPNGGESARHAKSTDSDSTVPSVNFSAEGAARNVFLKGVPSEAVSSSVNAHERGLTSSRLHRCTTASSPAIQHNLPQPDYERFIGREEELQQIRKLLLPTTRHFVITIDGVGGVGKTALALESAHEFLREPKTLPEEQSFQKIVWITAKRNSLSADGIIVRHQAFHTLEDIISVTSNLLGRPDILSADEQLRDEMVRHAFTQERTLLVIDNLETVDDERVLSFIKEVPAPTKVIVTTRHRIDIAYPIRLLGMDVDEARELIRDECSKKDVQLTEAEIKKLIVRTGGVPLAIVWSIAQMSLGFTPQATLDRLGSPTSDISKFCFEGVLESLRGTPAYYLLMALAYLGNNADKDVLGRAARLSELDRDEGLVILEKLSLLNKRGKVFHALPLTLAYCKAEIDRTPEILERISLPFLQGYLEKIKEYYGFVRLPGQSRPLPVDQIFVNIHVRPIPQNRVINPPTTSPKTYKEVYATDVAEIYDKLVVQGPPGSGKTMLMQFIALYAAKNLKRIPIFISLKQWADSGIGSLFEYAVTQLEMLGMISPRDYLQRLLMSGDAILLLDGLDEVTEVDGQRSTLVNEINQFSRTFSTCKYIVTSRVGSSPPYEFDEFQRVIIEKLRSNQIAEYVKSWFGAEKQKATLLLDVLRGDSNLVGLSRNPLFLGMLCMAFEEYGTLSISRVELYAQMVELILKKWDAARGIKRDDIYRELTTGRKRRLLSLIATRMFEGGRHLIDQAELEGIISSYISDLPQVGQDADQASSHILKSIEAQYGILVERRQGVYSFSLLVLQEYLVARYLADYPQATTHEILLEHLFDIRWREVILLTVELLPNADDFCGVLLEKLNLILTEEDELKRSVEWVLEHSMRGTGPSEAKWRSVRESLQDRKSVKEQGLTAAQTTKLHNYISICDILIRCRQDANIRESRRVEIEKAVFSTNLGPV